MSLSFIMGARPAQLRLESERASERTCEAANRSGGLIRKERAKEVEWDKRGHSHMTSALRGREVSPKADNSTDRLRESGRKKGC